MARNRRSHSAAIRFGPVLKVMLLCLLVGGTGVGYIWQKNQLYALGKEKKLSEGILEDLRRENQSLRNHLQALKNPVQLRHQVERLNRERNLGLADTQPERILVIEDASAPPSSEFREVQYAERREPNAGIR